MRNLKKGFTWIIILIITTVILAVFGVIYYKGQYSNFFTTNLIKDFFPQENKIINNIQSDCLPTTSPWIKVLYPNVENPVFVAGEQIIVKWKSCNIPTTSQDVYVSLRSEEDPQHSIILSDTVLNDGEEFFIIPKFILGSYKINIGTASPYIQSDWSDNSFTINSNNNLRKLGETCGEGIGSCEVGLKCVYPCGIPGCQNKCLPEDELPKP